MQRCHAERRRFTQDVAGGLGPRQADEQREGIRRGRRGAPSEAEREGVGPDLHQRTLSAGPVDHSGVKRPAFRPAQDPEQVRGPRIAPGQGRGQLGGFEENEVHASKRLRIAPGESRPKLHA